jgi:hypothetical protein
MKYVTRETANYLYVLFLCILIYILHQDIFPGMLIYILFHDIFCPPRYNWNIVESGIKYHKLIFPGVLISYYTRRYFLACWLTYYARIFMYFRACSYTYYALFYTKFTFGYHLVLWLILLFVWYNSYTRFWLHI